MSLRHSQINAEAEQAGRMRPPQQSGFEVDVSRGYLYHYPK
jgi:hypothetical protein